MISVASAQYKMRYPNSYYHPEKWPEYSLSLSKEGRLVDLFQAGIRPYYFPGMESNILEFKHARVIVKEPNGRLLPEFAVETAEIRPIPDGILYKLIFVSQSLTLAEAEVTARKWLPYVGRSEEELKKFLKAVESDPVRFNDPNFGAAPDGFSGGWSGESGERFSVWFRHNYDMRVPLRFCFRVDYTKARTLKQFRSLYPNRIDPPEGYEIQASPNNFGPDSAAEMMYAKGIPFMPGEGLGGSVSNVIEKPEEACLAGQNIVSPQNELEKKNVIPWVENGKVSIWLIIFGIFSTLGILVLIVIVWKRK